MTVISPGGSKAGSERRVASRVLRSIPSESGPHIFPKAVEQQRIVATRRPVERLRAMRR